jgi:hypothetical protein
VVAKIDIELEIVTTKTASVLAPFIYALDSPATRREYPIRLDMFLKFAGIPGKNVEERATAFLATNDVQFYRDAVIRYITYNKQRVLNKERRKKEDEVGSTILLRQQG